MPFPWFRTHWFWGDERFVPHDDALSNYRMVREVLLSRAPIPAVNIHPVPTEGPSPQMAATAYERELRSFYGAERLDPARPLFDVTRLGVGSDGHTASLFPAPLCSPSATDGSPPSSAPNLRARITLTYPALESSRHRAFLVEGREKQAMFDCLRRSDDELPPGRLRPIGTLRLFGDVAVAEISE